jgi:hypothetical protein
MMPLWVSSLLAGQTYALRSRSKMKSSRLNLPSSRFVPHRHVQLARPAASRTDRALANKRSARSVGKAERDHAHGANLAMDRSLPRALAD